METINEPDVANVEKVEVVKTSLGGLNVPLERDVFLRSLVRELAGALEELVGLEEAEGYISVVGGSIGKWIDEIYKGALNTSKLTREQVEGVLIDLKDRIHGDFYVIESSDDKIVFGNKACPFAEKVIGHPSMCMMTSNVFGGIAAENLGYAKVELQETIALKHSECRVAVYLKPGQEADAAEGREYFMSAEK